MGCTLLNKTMKIFKSIKFKLTFWYSTMLILISIVFVLIFNILVANYFNRQFENSPYSQVMFQRHIPAKLKGLTDENLELIYESRVQDLQTIRELSILSFLPLIIFSIGGGYIIADRMLKPLKDLNDEMKQISADNLLTKIKRDDTEDEISELIGNFNLMISRLDKSFKSQKQFVENAAHELKTPLSIIKINMEALNSEKRLTKKEKEMYTSNVKNSITLMNDLMEDLLLLSSIDRNVKMIRLNVNNVAKSAVNKLRSVAKKKDIKIEYKSGAKVEITGSKSLLERAIMNIIENAIRYSSEGSVISVGVRKSDQLVAVTVSDNGPGIPKRDQEKIFDRFYRVDNSRSKKTGGFGLGLSIVKDIVEKHNGKITLKSSKKGSKFMIKIPQK